MNKKGRVIRIKFNDRWLTIEEAIEKGLECKVNCNGKYVEVKSSAEAIKLLGLSNDIQHKQSTEEPFFDRISKTYRILEGLKGNVDKREYNQYVSKREIEDLMNDVKNELNCLYDNDNTNEVIMAHKEGQLYAYKLLLKLIDKQ